MLSDILVLRFVVTMSANQLFRKGEIVLEEFSFEGDRRLSRKADMVSSFYIVKTGGAILKGPMEDEIYMAGDLVDPVSLVTSRATGDVYTIGNTSLLAGTKGEVLDFFSKSQSNLLRLLTRTSESLSSIIINSNKNPRSADEIVNVATTKKQEFIETYKPLLFGEKSLYRKGVKLLERKDYDNSIEILRNYLQQFNNSPLTRPVKMFMAMAEMQKGYCERAMKNMMELFSIDSFDMVSYYIRELFVTFDLGLSTLQITRQKIYDEKFYNLLFKQYSDRILRVDNEQVLLHEGQRANNIVILLDGKMNISKAFDQKTFFVTEMSERSTFGELHILAGGKSDVTAMVETGSRIMLFDRDSFLEIITRKVPCAGIDLLKNFLEFEDELLSS